MNKSNFQLINERAREIDDLAREARNHSDDESEVLKAMRKIQHIAAEIARLTSQIGGR